MIDLELLKFAAKAAGINIYFDDDGDCYRVKEFERRKYWNPIHFDGDALRLAVALNLDILQDSVSSRSNCVEVIANESPYDDAKPCAWEVRAPDPLAATRLAIVRTAAKIGKSMIYD